jgi:hypothetical protein
VRIASEAAATSDRKTSISAVAPRWTGFGLSALSRHRPMRQSARMLASAITLAYFWMSRLNLSVNA